MKNGISKIYFGLALSALVFASAFFAACHNPIVERWWAEDPVPPPTEIIVDGNGGGSGHNFAAVVFIAAGGVPAPQALNIAWGGVIGRLRPMSNPPLGFLGWFDENGNLWDVETRQVSESDDVNEDGFITLRARWLSTPYTVSFVTGPAPAIPDQLIPHGGRIIQPVNPGTLDDGRGFAGWRIGSEPNDELWDFDRWTVDKDVTLYASWKYTTRNVEFRANGGTRPDRSLLNRTNVVVPVGGLIQNPGPLVRVGYSLAGWFSDDGTFEHPWDFSDDEVEAGDTTFYLYAKWVVNEYIVSFAVRSAAAPQPPVQRVRHGTRAVVPAEVATLPGAVFLGWFTNLNFDTLWDFNKEVTSNMTLYANWETTPEIIVRQIRIINVSFIDFAGDSVTYNQQHAVPPAISNLSNLQIANNIATLAEVVGILSQNPTFLLQLAGHANRVTQSPSEEADLERVSRARADAIVEELTAKGIDTERMINVGFNPRNLAQDAEHASLNRCVELVIIEIISK